MFVDELRNFHFKIGEVEEQWINENVEKLDDEKKLNFSRELRNYKEVTIMALKKVYQDVTGKKPNNYYWAVCAECGCEYDYELEMCPACYDRKLDCRIKAVKLSEFQPPRNVIRYNKTYSIGDKNEPVCYNCENKEGSYCMKFGNPDWNCKREEFETCSCKVCCSRIKAENRKIKENKKMQSISYAQPLGEK